MLGDHIKLLNAIRNKETLRRAYDYAVRCRTRNDYYYDYFDLADSENGRERVIEELAQELASPRDYIPRHAYAYFPPKTELCYRRMVYLPLKDLTARVAVVGVISDALEPHLSLNAFANRRATPLTSAKDFVEPFATKSWPRFVAWQEQARHNYPVLLKTDISAFYDSVSHEYLVASIARELHISPDCDFMALVKRLLRVPVISYDYSRRVARRAEWSEQGLSIGNTTEGVLANIFLKDVDEAMGAIDGIEFGRYSDDIRIFATTRGKAKDAMLVLQQLLLTRGLNLNSAKTEIAEDKLQMDELLSKTYEGYDYATEIELDPEEDTEPGPHAKMVDKLLTAPVEVLPADFRLSATDKPEKRAKDFCRYMNHRSGWLPDLLPLADRTETHVENLEGILTRWQAVTRFAAWLLVETAAREEVASNVRTCAADAIVRVLESDETSSYGKYRIIHHLMKPRAMKGKPNFFAQLPATVQTRIIETARALLGTTAFELNIASMYLLELNGESFSAMSTALTKAQGNPLPLPIIRALGCVEGSVMSRSSEAASVDSEVDDSPEQEEYG